MTNELRMVPELRFKGFSEDWEQRTFNKMAIKTSEITDNEKLLTVEYENIISKFGRLKGELSRNLHGRKGYKFVKNDILFGKLRPYLKYWLLADFEGIAIGDFWVLRSNNISSTFLYFLIQTTKFELVANQSTGTRMPRSDWNTVSNTFFNIPKDISEQNLIGVLLNQLDNMITLHQRKLSKIIHLKSHFYKYMIANKNLTTPTLRFDNFNQEWDIKSLQSIGNTYSGVGFPKEEQGRTEGIPFFKVSDMNLKGNEFFMTKSNNYVNTSQIKINNWKPITNLPAIIFAKVGAAIYLDRKRIVTRDFLIDNNMMSFSLNSNLNIYFIYSIFENLSFYKYAQVGSLPSLNSKDINKIKVKIPDFKEQEIIGKFFETLDESIVHTRLKLDNIKTIKELYLNKLFI